MLNSQPSEDHVDFLIEEFTKTQNVKVRNRRRSLLEDENVAGSDVSDPQKLVLDSDDVIAFAAESSY